MVFISIKEYLSLNGIEYEDALVRRIDKYLVNKIITLKQTKSQIKIGDKYLRRFLETDQINIHIKKIISNHENFYLQKH